MGTWWNRDSNFALDRYEPHPLFYAHGLNAMYADRGGTVTHYELRDDGLYSEATVSEGSVGDAILDLVASGQAAASSATMPHQIESDEDGYVRAWPIVEWSVLHQQHAGSWPGTTAIANVRAELPPGVLEEVGSSTYLQRSLFVNGQTPEPQQQPVQAPAAETTALATAVQNLSAQITQVQSGLEALRAQPAAALQPSPAPAAQRQIAVSSKYDDVSLFGLLHWDEHKRLEAARQGRQYQRDEAFMRALVDKARVAREGEQGVDAEAFDAWHQRVPYLRADEAMQSTLAGSGDELVPTLLNSVAHYEFRLQSRVLGLLRTFMAPSNPYDYPTISTGPRFRKANEATDRSQLDLSSSRLKDDKPTTGKITFSAGEIGVMSIASKTFFEDSGLAVATTLAQAYARNAARDIDYVLLNADERATTDNISHSADPTGTVYDSVLELDGLRRIAQAASDSVSHTTIATTSTLTLQALMGSRGIIGTDVNNLAVIVDPGVYYKLAALDDFQSMEKVGDRAFYLTGQIGYWNGMPVIVSDELEYADSNGKYPAAHNGTKGQFLIVHRELLMVGFRRALQMEQGNVPHSGLYAMSATVRLDLQAMETGAVAWGYNVTV